MTRRHNLDCVIVGHNTGNFQEFLAARKRMGATSGTYRDAQINSVRIDGNRITFMDLFNQVRKQVDPRAETLSAFDPLGLAGCTLTSFLVKRGLNVEFIGEFQQNRSLLDELLRDEPLAVALTTTFYFDPIPLKEMIAHVRRRSPRTTVIVGGPYISNIDRSSSPEVQDYLFKEIGADLYVIENQGEATLVRVLVSLRDGTDLSAVPNVAFASGERFARTLQQAEDNKIDENVVDWRLFDPQRIRPMTMVRTAISCPFSCSFCSYPVRAGEHRVSDVDRLEAEFRLLNSIGVRYVNFIDDTFNVPVGRFKDLCRMMIRNKFEFRWLSYIRCGNMDQEAVKLAAESGCVGALLGIESANATVLRNMNKVVAPENYSRGIRWLEDAGIKAFALLFIGFPGETAVTARETIKMLKETEPSFFATQMWFYDRTTPIHQQASRFQLKGGGYGWRHNTMTWQEAADLVDEMVSEVDRSIFIPQLSFSFETIFYLMGKGYDYSYITEFLRVSRRLMLEGLGDNPADTSPYRSRLVQLCSAQAVL